MHDNTTASVAVSVVKGKENDNGSLAKLSSYSYMSHYLQHNVSRYATLSDRYHDASASLLYFLQNDLPGELDLVHCKVVHSFLALVFSMNPENAYDIRSFLQSILRYLHLPPSSPSLSSKFIENETEKLVKKHYGEQKVCCCQFFN